MIRMGSLKDQMEKLDAENLQVHRALADVTTVRFF